ncbi:MAG: FAD binding domain-containing protein, partial [Actinobacteria bacterium]|nr:FAD binding domain-containing protein [Actinomycetota bacterium]
MEAFDYMRPTSVADACALLREAGGTARPLAGGTDILVQMREGKLRPAALVSLRDVP